MSPCTKRPRFAESGFHSNFGQDELVDPPASPLAPPASDDSQRLFEILLDYSCVLADCNLLIMSKTDLKSKLEFESKLDFLC